MIIIIFFENMVICDFLACLFNVHYLNVLSMVHEYAYFYEYIWKSVYYASSPKFVQSRKVLLMSADCLSKF